MAAELCQESRQMPATVRGCPRGGRGLGTSRTLLKGDSGLWSLKCAPFGVLEAGPGLVSSLSEGLLTAHLEGLLLLRFVRPTASPGFLNSFHTWWSPKPELACVSRRTMLLGKVLGPGFVSQSPVFLQNPQQSVRREGETGAPAPSCKGSSREAGSRSVPTQAGQQPR